MVRSARLCATLAVVLHACASGPSSTVTPPDPCAAYAGDLGVHGYCITQNIAAVREPKQMLESCASTGVYEGECRTRWVEAWAVPGSGATDHDVLSACLTDDCRFIALDQRAVSDTDAQAVRCKGAGKFGEDCARHAYQRWVASGPDEAAIQKMATGPGPFPGVAATYAGQAMACWHRGVCGEAWPQECAAGFSLGARDPTACASPHWGATAPPP